MICTNVYCVPISHWRKSVATEQNLFIDALSTRWCERSCDDSRLQRVVQLGRVEPGMSILDVGTGTGNLIPHLLERMNAEGHICGIDICTDKLRNARERRFPACVRLLEVDIHDLDHAEGSYHRVFCRAVVPQLQDKTTSLSNMHRMLKAGGMIVVSHPIRWVMGSRFHIGSGHDLMEHLPPDDAQMRELLEQAGFVAIETIDDPEFSFYRASKQ